MRAEQNTLGIPLDIQCFEIAAFRRGAHHPLGCLNSEHWMSGNLAGGFKRPCFDLIGRNAFFHNPQIFGGATVDLPTGKHKHARHPA